LQVLKNHGQVEDQWVYAAPGVVPRIKAHTFHITDTGRRELKLLQSIRQEAEPYPVGYRILLFMSHGGLMTIGQIAKMCRKHPGHIRRVTKSLQNKRLVDCLYRQTRSSFGHGMITHRYRITDLGRQILKTGVASYIRVIRTHPKRGKGLTDD